MTPPGLERSLTFLIYCNGYYTNIKYAGTEVGPGRDPETGMGLRGVCCVL
jgi:hypothetical protein